MSPAVSVIVPVFNAEPFLAETIASIRAQTFTDWEALFTDDASTDGSSALIANSAQADARITLLRHPANRGLSDARNTAIRQARGRWIAFLDADDVWLPTKLERQLQLTEQVPEANLLFCNYWIWDGANCLKTRYEKPNRFPIGNVSRELRRFNLFAPSSVLLKKETFDAVGLFDPELKAVQDWDLWLRISESGIHARGVWEPQLKYRVWGGNMSANSAKISAENIQLFQKAIARTQGSLQAEYRRSLQVARAHHELACARPLLDTAPEKLPAAILRAWRIHRRIEWLLWYLISASPIPAAKNWVRRKIRRKWSV